MDTGKRVVGSRSFTMEHMASMTMAALCGGGGVYAYMQTKSMPSLVAGVALGSIYGLSAYWIRSGRAMDGVDLSVLASTLLVIAMGPRAYYTRAALPVAMSSIGALIMARMGYTSYGLRHPEPSHSI